MMGRAAKPPPAAGARLEPPHLPSGRIECALQCVDSEHTGQTHADGTRKKRLSATGVRVAWQLHVFVGQHLVYEPIKGGAKTSGGWYLWKRDGAREKNAARLAPCM